MTEKKDSFRFDNGFYKYDPHAVSLQFADAHAAKERAKYDYQHTLEKRKLLEVEIYLDLKSKTNEKITDTYAKAKSFLEASKDEELNTEIEKKKEAYITASKEHQRMQEKLDAIKEQNSNARAETKLGGYGT